MLYLKKPLTGWFMQWTSAHDETMYNLYARILLAWAKENGFVCEHKFEKVRERSKDAEGRMKCLLCGDRVK